MDSRQWRQTWPIAVAVASGLLAGTLLFWVALGAPSIAFDPTSHAYGSIRSGATASQAGPQTASYPWVQPPAAGRLPTFPGSPGVQPPARVAVAAAVERPAVVGSG